MKLQHTFWKETTNHVQQHCTIQRGNYYVDTVGKNKGRIAEYIKNQLKEDELGEQLVIPSASPFTGRK